MALHGSLRRPVLPLPELHPHTALNAADYAGEGGAVRGELARKVPRLRVGELPVHLTVFHREALERLVDPFFLRQRGADQSAHDGAVRALRELQLDVVIEGGDAGATNPSPGERVGDARLDLNRRRRFRL